MELYNKFLILLKALHRYEVEYILIGGYAVVLHGYSRTTQDMDLMLNGTDVNISKLRTALGSVYQDDSIEEIQLNELNEYAVIRYGTPDDFNIDLILRIGQVADYNSIEFEEKIVDGEPIKVATPKALYEMKRNTVRPQDRSDAVFLAGLISGKK